MKTVHTWISIAVVAAVAIVLAEPARGSLFWNWNTDYTGAEDGTLLLWKFENTDTELEPFYGHDSSGNGYNASFAAIQTELGVPGRFGLGFRSVEPKVNANNGWAGGGVAAFDTSQLVVEMWFKPYSTHPGVGLTAFLFDKMRGDTNTGARLIIPTTGDGDRLQARVGNGTGFIQANSVALSWDTDTWYHIALIYSADVGNLSVYRNGVQVISSTNDTFGELATNSHGWRVGNRGISNHGSLPGYYDNFRVSNIPEPNVLALVGLGLAATVLRRRRG